MPSPPVSLHALVFAGLCLASSQAAAQASAELEAESQPVQSGATTPAGSQPTTVRPGPSASAPLQPQEVLRLQEEERRRIQQQERLRIRAERQRVREHRERARRLPRLLLTGGYAGGFAARFLGGRKRERVRLRAATLGVGYQQSFNRTVGVHVMVTGGAGRTAFALRNSEPRFSFDREYMGAGFAAELEAGPLIGTFGPFYVAPLLHARTWWVSRSSATLTVYDVQDGSVTRSGEEYTRAVQFDSPVVLIGLRLLLGVMYGEEQQYDVGFGFDLGWGGVGVDRYMGTFVRVGFRSRLR